MALALAMEFKGIPVAQAYVKVVMPSIMLGNQTMEFGVHYMASPESPMFSGISVQCPYDIEGDNPVKQAYNHLKTLPEFQGCTDC